ncbi:MAG: hypothetical protein K6L73_11220 [Cellvibrionaceae bacterium]
MSKLVLVIGLLLSSVGAYGDCVLGQYEKFIKLQNQSYSEALVMMKEADKDNYQKVKDFVAYHQQFNNLYLYLSGKLQNIDKSLLSYKSGISRLVKDRRRIVNDNKLAYVWDEVLANDERYKKEISDIRSQQNYYFYYKPKTNKPEDMEKVMAFKEARTVFNSYLDKTKQMPEIRATYSKTAEELCAAEK